MLQMQNPDWLAWPQTQRLLVFFSEAHMDICFVGAAVRKRLLGCVANNISCLTSAPLGYVLAVAVQEGLNAQLHQMRTDHVVLEVGGVRFHVATLGEDNRHEGMLTRVKLHVEKHFDFTLDALVLTTEGELHDPFGGVEDLQKGQVIFLQLPAVSMDPYRCLRYFRLVGEFSQGIANGAIVALCAQRRESLRRIEGEFRYREIVKIALAPRGVRILRLLAREWMLTEALGFGVSDVQGFEHMMAIEGLLKIDPDKETRMLLFAALASIPAAETMRKLAQPYGWGADMLSCYIWMAERLRERVIVMSEWKEKIGEKGYQHMVLVQWALEDDVVEAAPFFSALLGSYLATSSVVSVPAFSSSA